MDKKKRVAASVILIAFAFGLNITGVTPVLGTLSEKYGEYGTSTVQLLQTVPYLLIMVGSFMIGWLTTKFTKKKIVMCGLLIIGVCGVIPFFTENFYVLFATRVLIGFGFGIVGPLNTAIITDFFPPEERAGYMGLHVLGMGIGAMVGNVLGGALAGFGYQTFYLVYGIALISMAAVIKSCYPFSPLRVFICGTMATGTFGALAILPSLFEVSSITGEMAGYIAIGSALAFVFIFILELLRRVVGSREKKRGETA